MADNAYQRSLESVIACPQCGGSLITESAGVMCPDCDKRFPLVEGIQSFVVDSGDTWHSYYQDRVEAHDNEVDQVAFRFKRSYRVIQNAVRQSLPDFQGKTILDIGCGNGLMTGFLAENNTVFGADFTLGLLHVTRKRSYIPVHADARSLPFRKECFDLVAAVEILENIEDAAGLVKYWGGFVKPGGGIFIASGNRHSVQRRMWRAVRPFVLRDFAPEHSTILHDPSILAESVRKSGFEVEMWYTAYPLSGRYRWPESKHVNHAATNFYLLGRKR